MGRARERSTACAKSASAARMAMCFASPFWFIISRVGSTITPHISAGTSTVVIQKALVRTRSRYSRLMMTQTLCIAIILADHVDEDLLERWLDQLELRDARARREQLEQLLRVGAGRQLHLDVIAVVVRRLHQVRI